MTNRELIEAELDRLSEEELDELYRFLRGSAVSKQGNKRSFMSKLRSISIDAPEDFSTNFDLYASGEKAAESHIR